jgi:hypothetical protein
MGSPLAAPLSRWHKSHLHKWPLEPIFIPPAGVVSGTSMRPTLFSPPPAQLLHVLEHGESLTCDDNKVIGLDGIMLQGQERDSYSTIKVYNLGGWCRDSQTFKAYITSIEYFTPTMFHKAIESPFTVEWRKAMEEEVHSLIHNNMWILVPQLGHKCIIKGKFVFKLKVKPNGQIDHYKACWVAKGFMQQWGDDYTKTYVPVVVFKNLWFILALACLQNLEIHTMDIVLAFLHAELVKEIYVEQLEGYVNTNKPDHVC